MNAGIAPLMIVAIACACSQSSGPDAYVDDAYVPDTYVDDAGHDGGPGYVDPSARLVGLSDEQWASLCGSLGSIDGLPQQYVCSGTMMIAGTDFPPGCTDCYREAPQRAWCTSGCSRLAWRTVNPACPATVNQYYDCVRYLQTHACPDPLVPTDVCNLDPSDACPLDQDAGIAGRDVGIWPPCPGL
jgi:hypothetical protein